MAPPSDKVEDDFAGLTAILKVFQELAPNELKLTETDEGETAVRRLGWANAQIPVGVFLARRDNTLLLAVGTTLPEQILALMDSGDGEGSLAATARFKEAFKGLPAPKDELSYVDISRLVQQGRRFVKAAMMSTAPPEGDAQAEKVMALPDKIADFFDIFEYSASVKSTDGLKSVSHCVTLLKEGAEDAPLYKIFLKNGQISEPLKFIPVDATDMSVSGGIDLSAAYDAIIEFVKTNVPDGAAHIEAWNANQETQGIHVREDILSWLGGQFTSFTVPGKTPYSPPDWVLMVSVTDEAKAREMLERGLAAIAEPLKQQSGSIADAVIEDTVGFKSIVHPLAGMVGMTRPTVGVAHGALVLGSSPKIIARSFDVAGGKEDSFAKSERFRKEGVEFSGPINAISFTDESNLGQELGQVLQMVPMLTAMPPMNQMFSDPRAAGLLRMVSKLGPVVQQLDFLLSTSSVSKIEGRRILTQTISNYQKPAKGEVAGGEPN
jgi:hypothetical protein